MNDLRYERKNAEKSLFKRCYGYAANLAALLDIQPAMPRIASRQKHRDNIASETPFQYFLLNVCYPFLDHITTGIESRFDKYGTIVHKMHGLIPAVIAERDLLIDAIVKEYQEDLPMLVNVHEEFARWKRRWKDTGEDERPSTIAKALKICDSSMYPNLHTLLRICATVPVTSCECERSGSVLKRLNSYLRASMGQQRLSGLAFLHINYDKDIDIDRVIDIFSTKKERALEFKNICDDS